MPSLKSESLFLKITSEGIVRAYCQTAVGKGANDFATLRLNDLINIKHFIFIHNFRYGIERIRFLQCSFNH